jgi:hypothetical protein
MGFKINKKTRVKIPDSIIHKIRIEYTHKYNTRIYHKQLMELFHAETGLSLTSTRRTSFDIVYYFQVLDKHKYMLGKIKYGF